MGVIADVTDPYTGFVLGRALRAVDDAEIRLEGLVPLERAVVPYLWVAGGAGEAARMALAEVPGVASVATVERVGDSTLLRVEWEDGAGGLLTTIVESRGRLLDARRTDERWRFRVGFPDHGALSAFHESCTDRGLDVELEALHDSGLPGDDAPGARLTDAQREALSAALEAGYFEVPRRTRLLDLADELGVSDTAVSQRLRRGTATVLSAVLPPRRVTSSNYRRKEVRESGTAV